jgi:hypothetical protein
MSEAQTQTPTKEKTAPPATAKTPPKRSYKTLLEALERAKDDRDPPQLLLTPRGARMLVGWLLAQGKPVPKDAAELVAYARQLRTQFPMLWKPLLAMNFLGFVRAAKLCNLGGDLTWDKLQNACSAVA